MGTTPTKKDTSHMLEGPDDSHVIKKLCSGWVKQFDVSQDTRMVRSLDNPIPWQVPSGAQELTLRIMTLGGVDRGVMQSLLNGEYDIMIRPRRR